MIRYWAVQITVMTAVLVALGLVSLSILWALPGKPEAQRVGYEINGEER